MSLQLEHPAEETTRLQRCISQLVSVLSLPSLWSGGEPSQVLHTLLDGLLRMLQLDLAYVRLKDSVGQASLEMVRVAPTLEPLRSLEEICEMFGHSLGEDPRRWPARIGNPIGDGDISILALPLGLRGEIGVIVAGSQRADFPEQTEKLVLNVAANQAAIGLHGARLLSEQKRVTCELDGRWRSVFENSAVGVALTDLNGRFIATNPVYQKMLGYAKEELQKLSFLDITYPEDREHSWAFVEELLDGTVRQFQIEKQYRRKDGSLVWVRNNVSIVPGTESLPQFLMALSEDITERKQAEAALRASEQSFRLIVDGIAGLVAIITATGEIEHVNRQVLEYFGKTIEDLGGWSPSDGVHPDDLPGVVSAWRRSIETASPYDADHRLRRSDGAYRWFHARGLPLLDAEGRILRWYILLTDIDDRRRAEEALKRSEAFLAEGQRLSLTGSFSWRVATDEITWSDEMYRIFEFEQGTAVTIERILTRVHPEDLALVNATTERARGGISDLEFEHRLLMPDHSIKYLHLTAHGERDKNRRLEYIGAVQDVTRRQRAEEALTQARSELANVARVTSLGVLTASIAHEVNQPLSGIVTNASTCLRMLATDPPNVDGARETARRAIRDGNRAAEVISRLRALYGRKDAATEPVDLNQAAREVIALSLNELQRNRVIVRPEFGDNLPLVTGDRVQIQQVIMNLLRNAVDAMRKVEDRPRELFIRTEPDEGQQVRLSVKDAGVGFEPQFADRLFQAFYTTKQDGMGIGLSVSRSIIENHHGRLWATRNDGPGATFSFSIPCGIEDQP